MNRRAFFVSLAALASTGALDPERLLWVPGRKLISIPKPAQFRVGDVILVRLPARFLVRYPPLEALVPATITDRRELVNVQLGKIPTSMLLRAYTSALLPRS